MKPSIRKKCDIVRSGYSFVHEVCSMYGGNLKIHNKVMNVVVGETR